MSRADTLAKEIDLLRLSMGNGKINNQPARELWKQSAPSISGEAVAAIFGPYLLHYTLTLFLHDIIRDERIGLLGRGVWLTPSPYGACVAPYNLGLSTGRDLCITVLAKEITELWGPGKSGAGIEPWPGGAIEFYSPVPLPLSRGSTYHTLESCGDL